MPDRRRTCRVARSDRARRGGSSARTSPWPSPTKPRPPAARARRRRSKPSVSPSSCCRSPISRTTLPRTISLTASPKSHHRPLAPSRLVRDRAQHRLHLQGQECRRPGNRQGAWRPLRARRICPARRGSLAGQCPAHRRGTGDHLWADGSTSPSADLFEMQDEIVARLAKQLGAELIAAEARRTQQAPNPDSMDLYFQGQASLNKGRQPRKHGAGARLLRARPGARPRQSGRSARSRAGRLFGGRRVSVRRSGRPLAAAEAAIAKVLSQRPNDALAHEIMGGILNQTKRSEQGIAELERALALDPNLATAHGDIGLAKILAGSLRGNGGS